VALLYIAKESWHTWRFSTRRAPSPEATEGEIAFRETVLRHGTWFLFAHVRGYSQRGRHGQMLMRQALLDLQDWELGQGLWDMVPGLHMALMSELRKRFGLRRGDAIEVEALLRVDEMVRGTQTTRPVTFMFANPPHWREELHGWALSTKPRIQ
jgi:hypothetical protein